MYLGYVLKLYKNDKFHDFISFIDYLYYGNLDSFDVLIPIESFVEKDRELFELKNQKIEIREEHVYCKVYDNNTNDLFYLIKENIIRIESLFNLLRLYRNSGIDFCRDQSIIVYSKYFNENFELSFDEIDRYTGPTPYAKNLKRSVRSLDILKDNNRSFYHTILNAISYAEKDKDIMSASSYVDNWISIESLLSTYEKKTGYNAVKEIVPKMLSAKLILNDLTNTLDQAYKNYEGPEMRAEKFIALVCQGKYDFDKIVNPYFNLELKRVAKFLSNIKELSNEFSRIEQRLDLDLLRIYVLRNEYVHASNLQAFNSLQQIKLRHLLPLSIDEFFIMLNYRIDKEASEYGLSFDIYSEILNKHDTRQVAFKLFTEKPKLSNGSVCLECDINQCEITLDEFIFNIIKNNLKLFKKYIPREE